MRIYLRRVSNLILKLNISLETTTNKLKNKKILSVTPCNYNGTSRMENNTSIYAKPNLKGNPFLDLSEFKGGKSDLYNSEQHMSDDDGKDEHLEAN